MQKRYYAVKAYGKPGLTFPKFWESFPTLAIARKTAKSAITDGFTMCEIYRDKPTVSGYFGIQREMVETIGAT